MSSTAVHTSCHSTAFHRKNWTFIWITIHSSFQLSVVKPKPKQLLRPIATDADNPTNQSEREESIHVAGAKRVKALASKSRLVLILPLIGREVARFFLLANHKA